MKILLTYRDYFNDLPGGIERHIHQLAHGLKNSDHVEVSVGSAAYGSGTIDDDGVRVSMLRELARFQGVPLILGNARWMRQGGFDLIHLHSPNPAAEWAFLTGRTGAGGVATYHADIDRGSRLGRIYRPILRASYLRLGRIIVSSERLVDRSPFLASLPTEARRRIRVVPLAVDLGRFTPGEPREPIEIPTVLFVGRIRYYKGVDVLIEAMRDLPARLLVVGGGPLYEETIHLGQKRLGDRFEWTGPVPDAELPRIYRRADIFCLPSTSHAEAFGMATLEAMASGLPVITTEVGTATSLLNRHGETGLVVEPGSADSLRKALAALIRDVGMRSQMGRRSQEVASGFGVERMVRDVRAVYEEAVSKGA